MASTAAQAAWSGGRGRRHEQARAGDRVWVDYEYDREFAGQGSRYAAYVRQWASAFGELFDCYEGVDLIATFASTAWTVATGPVMAPGYVRCHERVQGSALVRSHWDGRLAVEVDLAVGWPQKLAQSREWRAGRWWDWPRDLGTRYEPSAADEHHLDKHSYLTCTAKAVFGVDMSNLPDPDPDDLETSAAATVAALVDELNPVISPIVAQLEGHR